MARSALEISYETPGNRRESFRALVTDIHVRVEGKSDVYSALDLSPNGIGVKGIVDFEIGEPVILALFHQGEPVVIDLIARVARMEEGFTGLYFENLDRHQSEIIHAIVIYAQKQLADSNKFQPSLLH